MTSIIRMPETRAHRGNDGWRQAIAPMRAGGRWRSSGSAPQSVPSSFIRGSRDGLSSGGASDEGPMTAARGDRRPCVVGGCSGEMQYGRRSDQERGAAHAGGAPRDDGEGWICSLSADHFTRDVAAAERAGRLHHSRP